MKWIKTSLTPRAIAALKKDWRASALFKVCPVAQRKSDFAYFLVKRMQRNASDAYIREHRKQPPSLTVKRTRFDKGAVTTYWAAA